MGVRQVFPRHCLLHAVCLAIVAQHNCRRCASLAAELPWLLGAAARAAGAARRLSRWVFLLPLRGRLALVLHQLVDPRRGLAAWPEGRAAPGGGAAAASQAGCDHELLAACHAVLLFCQLLLSFCTPCYLLWRTEHASRRRFLAHVQRRWGEGGLPRRRRIASRQCLREGARLAPLPGLVPNTLACPRPAAPAETSSCRRRRRRCTCCG